MNEKQFRLGKRVVALILILLMFFSYIPANVVYGAIDETQVKTDNVEKNIADEGKNNIQEDSITENVNDTKDEFNSGGSEDSIKEISNNETDIEIQNSDKENIIENDNSIIDNTVVENEISKEEKTNYNEINNNVTDELEISNNIDTDITSEKIVTDINKDEVVENDELEKKDENSDIIELQELSMDKKVIQNEESDEKSDELDLTWQDILEYGPYVSMAVKYGEEISKEEIEIYNKYKELVYGKGAELSLIAAIYGTESFSEEELAIYNAYLSIVENGAEKTAIQTLGIEVPGESENINGSEIVSEKPFGEGVYNLCYLAYDKEGGESHTVWQSLKYVVPNADAKPEVGITPMSYCMNVEKNFIDKSDYNGSAWNNNWSNSENYEALKPVYQKLYSELSYAVSIGCKTYGTNNEEKYSTAGSWQEDYYVTQSVIYIIIDDYINNLEGENGVLSTMDINLTPEQIAELKKDISNLFSGHSKASLKIANPDKESGHYSAERQNAVLNAVNNMYDAVINYRENIGDNSDGYDASITINADNTKLKYEDGKYTATVRVDTTGTIKSDSEIILEGPKGMTYTKKPGTTNEYEISIPASSIESLEEISIIAKAQFNGNKTVTYISNTYDRDEETGDVILDENGGKVYGQNMSFFQIDENNSIEKSNSIKFEYAPTVELSGNKTWLDNNNEYVTRPENIIISLLANGKIVETKTITKDNDWAWKFVGHPEFNEDGKKIEYTISEKDVLNYETSYDTTNGLNIINKLVGKTQISGEKTWIDNNNAYGTRPESIIVQLLANNEIVAEKIVKADENGKWEYAFTDLDKYDENGVEYKYSILENEVKNYVTTIKEGNIINKLQEKIDIAGTKIWNDSNNEYKTRPGSIVVQLLANGKKVAEKIVKANENGKWEYAFTDLDKYDENCIEINYRITEKAVDRYATTIEGNNIINTLIHNHIDFEYDITQAQAVYYNSGLDSTPKTGNVDLLLFFTNTALISLLGIISLKGKNKKEGK